MLSLSCVVDISLMFLSSIRISPSYFLYNLVIKLNIVVLPLPDLPTKAILSPLLILKLMFFNTKSLL